MPTQQTSSIPIYLNFKNQKQLDITQERYSKYKLQTFTIINTLMMQLQQLQSQNNLLQQLVETLERQIQSKNQEQTIIIQQLEHLIKDNDSISSKYSMLLAQSRQWNDKEKYYHKLLKQIEETLLKTRLELTQTQKKLAQQSQQQIKENAIQLQNNQLEGQSSSHIQVYNAPHNNTPINLSNRRPQTMHSTSHLYVSVSRMNSESCQFQQKRGNSSQKIPMTPEICLEQQKQAVDSAKQTAQQLQKLQAQIKSLKTLSQSFKLQLTHKDLELKSKNQKLHQTSQQLITLHDQVENLKDLVDDLRKENCQLLGDLEEKEKQIQSKDDKFFEMYKEMDEEWKGKLEKVQEDKKMLQYSCEDRTRELEAKEEQVKSLEEGVQQLKIELQQKNIQTLSVRSQKDQNNQEGTPNYQQLISSNQPQDKGRHQQQQNVQQLGNKRTRQIQQQLIRQKQQLTSAQEQLMTANSHLNSQLTSITSINQSLRAHLRSLAAQVQTGKVQLVQYGNRICQLEEENKQLQNQLRQSENVFYHSQQLIQQLQDQNHNLATQLDSLNYNITQPQKQPIPQPQPESPSILPQLENQNIQLKQQLSSLTQRFQQIGLNLQQMKYSLEQLQNQLKLKNLQIQRHLYQHNQHNQQISKLQSENNQHNQQILRIQHQNNQLQEHILKLKSQKNQLNNDLIKLRQQNDRINQNQEKRLYQKNQQLQKIQNQNNQLTKQPSPPSYHQQPKQLSSFQYPQQQVNPHQPQEQKEKSQEQKEKSQEQKEKSTYQISAQPSCPSLNKSHIELQMFEVLQNQYTKLYDQTEELKIHQQQENIRFLSLIKQKDSEIHILTNKLHDLTKLFTLKNIQHQQLTESIHKKLSSGEQVQNGPGSPTNLQLGGPSKGDIVPSKNYTSNNVQNYLSSKTNNEQMTSNQGDSHQINEKYGFSFNFQPAQRKSDLPMYNQQFNSSQIKPSKPKNTFSHIKYDQNIKSQLQQPPQIDINYLRNSIAQFGLDIDFNAIAKHIGLELSEEQENQKKQIQSQIKNNSTAACLNQKQNQFSTHQIKSQYLKDDPINDINDIHDGRLTDDRIDDKVINSHQGILHSGIKHQGIDSNNKNKVDSGKKKQAMYSSYGSNPSNSQKYTTPGVLKIPMLDEQQLRSSYSSNNQFTQIVLYYEQELSKLRQRITQLAEQIRVQKQMKEQRAQDKQIEVKKLQALIKEKDEKLEMAQKENEQNQIRIEETQIMLVQIRNQLDLKEREQYSRQIQQRIKPQQQQNNNEDNNSNSNQKDNNQTQYNNQNQNIKEKSLHLPQTTEFRTSIQPSLSSSLQNNKKITLSPQEHQQTVQLITQLSSQIEIMQQRLSQTQSQLQSLQQKNHNLTDENIQLVKELQLLKKDYQNIVSQFSELSLQQNNQMTSLQTKFDQLNQQTQKIKEENQQLLKINKELFDQQNQQTQQNLKTIQHQFNQKLQKTLTNQLNSQRSQLEEEHRQKNTLLTVEYERQLHQLTLKLQEKSQFTENVTIQNIQKDAELLKLNQQISALILNLQETQKVHHKNVQEKDHLIKKLEKSHKQSKEQLMRLSNENQTLAKDFSRLLKVTKDFQNLSKKYHDLQAHNKSLQQALGRLSISQRQGNQSPVFLTKQRISDLMEPSNQQCQQNFSINNISNIHAIVDQLGDDSFVLQQKDKEISSLKDVIERQRRQIQQLKDQVNDREIFANELDDKLANVDNSYNSQIMGIKRLNAQLNSELLKLKKQLFTYQKDSGDIQKFIQENFMLQKVAVPTRFSTDDKHAGQFQSSASHQINRSQSNNSFHLESHNAHELSNISARNRTNMTQFYYPKQKQSSTCYNMGEMFMGHKGRTRQNINRQNNNSLTQLIKNITSNNKQKSLSQLIEASGNKPEKEYKKYLNEYQRYEQKFGGQNRNEFSYGMIRTSGLGHGKKD